MTAVRDPHTPTPTAPTALELGFGFTFGTLDGVDPLPVTARTASPRAAVESALLAALQRPPCVISFSGGRDSSALLALAADVARRHGLPLPIAVTNRFEGQSGTDEDSWQREVLDHIGGVEHQILEFADELGFLGPYAQAFLRRHGMRWPANTHMHAAIADLAAGGTLVTGFGGDEVAGSSERAYGAQVLGRRRPPRPRDALVLAFAAAPAPLRRAVHRRRARGIAAGLPWLTPAAVDDIARRVAIDEAASPVSWGRQLTEVFWPSRYLQLCLDSFRRLGSDRDVHVVHPFVEPATLAAFAHAGGTGGLGSRAEVLRLLTGDLLPEVVLRRRSKAVFNAPLWTAACVAFTERWSGAGLDPDVVDAAALRRDWRSRSGSVRACPMIQTAWLHDVGATPDGR